MRRRERRSRSRKVKGCSSSGPRRVILAAKLAEGGAVEGRETGVALGRGMDEGEVEPRGLRQGERVDLGAADDHDLGGAHLAAPRSAASRQRLVPVVRDRERLGAEKLGSRVSTTVSRPGSGRPIDWKVLRPMMQRLAPGERAKAPEIAPQPPDQPVVAADDAVVGDRRDDRRAGTLMVSAASLASASPSSAVLRSIRPSRSRRASGRSAIDGSFQSSTHHSSRARPSSAQRRARRASSALPMPLAAEGRADEEILEIDAVPAAKGREAVEPEREARWLALPFGDVAEDARVRPEQRRGDHRLRGVDLVREPLVLRELADEGEDERGVGRGGGADAEATGCASRGSAGGHSALRTQSSSRGGSPALSYTRYRRSTRPVGRSG